MVTSPFLGIIFRVFAISITSTREKNAKPQVIYVNQYENASIGLGESEQYHRKPNNFGEQIYTVCTGTNVEACGYWEDIETKKKIVDASKTTVDLNTFILTMVNVSMNEGGTYWSDDINEAKILHIMPNGIPLSS
ncbi:unnamed protein product [Caenorhabditis angaria]|uniref:Uncharacterized protein n=1 Tax=Caenorhabditis angaria TaxID=860376 RepID=A0A9P1IXW5_9PELO|nr:unnamed protein product [Caenorhabditis angaria]